MPLALLEHVNLNVPDREVARIFYVDCLGGVVNPKTTNERQLHVNVGASQFHLLLVADAGTTPVTIPQVWAGHMEMWSREPLEAIQERLTAAGYAWNREEASPASGGLPHVLCRCPWGNRFILRTAPAAFDPATLGVHPGGAGTLLALTRVVQLVRPGAAARLHQFWTTALGARSELVEAKRADSSAHAHCVVRFASGQQLIFDERDDAPAADAYEREEASAYHLCVYIDHMDRFRESFSACEALGVLYANQRFANSPPEFGNAMEWELARTCGQFRIKDMGPAGASAEAAVDVSDGSGGAVSGGGAALVLELEVRSVMHKSCPLSRADVVAGGGEVPVAPAFANMSPLKPPPHAQPGVIRIPHGRGGFGEAARALAAEKAESK